MKERNSETFNYQRLDLVYSKRVGIYVVSFACASVFTYYYYQESLKFEFIAWLSAFCFYFLLRRISVVFYWRTKSSGEITTSQYELINTIICFYGGLLWGSSSILFLTDVTPEKMIVAMTIYAGICSGATGTNSATLKGNYSFSFALIASALIGFSLGQNDFKETLMTIFGLYLVGLGFSIYSVHQSIIKNISLRLDKERLLADIEEANTKRMNTERQALQSSKMAAIGEMASGMAHEINNPLTIIKGNLTLLSRRIYSLNNEKTDELSQTSINRCNENIQRIVETINSLKRMSRVNDNNMIEPISVDRIVEDAIGFINEKLKCSNIKLHNEIKEENVIHCNSVSISQILLGLIMNAYHLSLHKPHAWIRLEYNEDSEFSYFEVSHSACELDKEEILNALNKSSEFKQNPRVYNLTLARSLSHENHSEIYLKTTISGCALVLKVYKKQSQSNLVAA